MKVEDEMRQGKLLHKEKAKTANMVLPHAFNYMLKEEILHQLNDIDSKKVSVVSALVREKKVHFTSNVLAEKIMKGA
jgi:hypothetical protein